MVGQVGGRGADVKPALAGEPETAVVRSVTLTQNKTKTPASDAEGYVALAAVDGVCPGFSATLVSEYANPS